MPSQAAGLKHTGHHGIGVVVGDMLRLPHHSKPFRKRHILLLVVSFMFIAAVLLETATIVIRQTIDPRSLFSQSVTEPEVIKPIPVRSSLGFTFVFNPAQFSASVVSDKVQGAASEAELGKNAPLASVIIKPLPSFVPSHEAATELEARTETDAAAFATYKAAYAQKADIATITADYFSPPLTNLATIRQESRAQETLNGSSMIKTVYVVNPKFAGAPTRTIVWSAQVAGKPVAVTIRGISMDTVGVPTIMQPIVTSLQISTEANVKGLSIFAKKQAPVIDQAYVADLVSPAVVKVYHAICGSLEYNGSLLSGDMCSGKTGSGFLVSGDGYIATNGHVVVYGAKDMLADALLQNPALLQRYLSGLKFTNAQIREVLSRSDLTAAAVAKVYDIPDSNLRLRDQRGITLAATGKTALQINDEAALKKLIGGFESTNDLKQAVIVGYDYEPEDKLRLASGGSEGFSASDVALLKIDVSNAPFVKLVGAPARQNQPITLFGFPGDADNELIDASTIDVTVTNGSINAVRDAAGTGSKLYQTDADASRGNSGGPAVDRNGEAIGILTYRYSSGTSGDAAKSYVRDIKDFSRLADSKRVTLNTQSDVQDAWARGLDFYSKQYYSKALEQFEKVQRLYPSHRLAEQYADMSRQAIKDGKDVKELSAGTLLLIGGIGMGGLLAAAVFITRHYGNHKLYRFGLLHQHVPAAH